MEKSKSSKKDRLEKLRISLESNSNEKLHPEDEKYLKVLQNRLSKNSKEGTVNIYRESGKSEEKDDPLKPQVIIHHKEEKQDLPEFIQTETEKVEVKEEKEIKDKELFEVKKVEVIGPEFLEVKPKESIKKIETSEKKITQKIEETEHEDYQKLPEWEPVETKIEKVEQKAELEEKNELKEEEEKKEFTEVEEQDVEPAKEEVIFEEKNELESETLKEPVEEKKKEPSDLESLETEPGEFEITGEEKPEHEENVFFDDKREYLVEGEKQSKLDAFKNISSIDEKTANLLYYNGFISLDDLRSASVKDLSRIKGIKRKLAKKIKKELQELDLLKEGIAVKPKEDTSEAFLLEEEVEEAKKEEEFLPEEEFMEDEKMFFEEDEEQTSPKKKDERIEVFKSMESIDEKTASLLVENGIISLDILKETPVKKLIEIEGIDKKLAKKIKKELKKKSKKTKKTAFSIAEGYDKDVSKDFEESPSEQGPVEEIKPRTETKKIKKQKPREKKKSKQYKHEGYTLYKKDVKTKSKKSKDKKKREVYFFSKQKRNKAEPSDLPKGFEVRINRKTGVPYLRKKE